MWFWGEQCWKSGRNYALKTAFAISWRVLPRYPPGWQAGFCSSYHLSNARYSEVHGSSQFVAMVVVCDVTTQLLMIWHDSHYFVPFPHAKGYILHNQWHLHTTPWTSPNCTKSPQRNPRGWGRVLIIKSLLYTLWKIKPVHSIRSSPCGSQSTRDTTLT